jgi:photosystem II stability/assembly factor-like uncharacterized protein
MRLLFALCTIVLSASSLYSQKYLTMIETETFTVQEIIDNAEAYFSDKGKGKGTGYKQFKRWEYNAERLMNENGYLRTSEENLAELQRQDAYLNETASSRNAVNDNWQELGPTSINPHTSWSPGLGRITSISVDKDDSDHIIVGANTGGVWKTTDGGQNWIPLTDYFSNLYVYSVVIDPMDNDTYYFGSSYGRLYKSTDAGATWQLFATISDSVINKLLLHPSDPTIMYLSSANRGIYRSSNSGTTWTEIAAGDKGYDVEFKPGDPSVVYASGTEVFVSTDNGLNFTTFNSLGNGPKMIAVTAANPEVLYIAEASSGRFNALYKSENSGVSFSQLANNSINYFGYSLDGLDTGGQAPRDMDIAVSPVDENEVHLAGVNTWMSLDGGATFNTTANWVISVSADVGIGYCHADVDILLFEDDVLYVGSDGGIFKAEDSQNITANYYTDLSTGIGIKQLYKVGVAQGEELRISIGSQDNGTSVYREDTDWQCWIGADGMETFIMDEDNNLIFGTTQYGNLYKSTNGATTLEGMNEPGPGEGNWVTPFEQGNENGVIYVGYDQVYKSINYGNSWGAISQNLGGNLNNLKIAPSNSDVMYATRGYRLYKTIDGGATSWVQMAAPGGTITSVAIHPTDANKIAATTTSGSKAYMSLDGGESWINYRKNLPNFSALCLVWDHNGRDGIYLGMDYGIYYIDNDLEDWIPFNTNLPNVIVNELEINKATRTLYAGTYGRGTWFSPMLESTLGTATFTSEILKLYPNPAREEITLRLPVAAQIDIRVFDMKGSLLSYDRDVQINGEHTLNISGLKTGVYFMRIASESGTITKKFIKE